MDYLNTYPVKAYMNFIILLDEAFLGFNSTNLITIRVLVGYLKSTITLIVIDFAVIDLWYVSIVFLFAVIEFVKANCIIDEYLIRYISLYIVKQFYFSVSHNEKFQFFIYLLFLCT